MVAGVFAELARERPRRRFTIGINDDVSGTSLPYDPSLDIEPRRARCARSSSASAPTAPSAPTRTRSRSSATRSGLHAQGYFVYDSKKSGSQTVSHLRFGPTPIRAPYLVAAGELRRLPPVRPARAGRRARTARPHGATLLLNCRAAAGARSGTRCPPGAGADPRQAASTLYVIDAGADRPRGGPGRAHQHRPADLLLRHLRACCRASRRSSGSRRRSRRPTAAAAPRSCKRNQAAVDQRAAGLHRVEVPERVTCRRASSPRWCPPTRRSSSAR